MAELAFSVQKWLSTPTPLGVKLWILILTSVPLFLLLIAIPAFAFHLCSRRRRNLHRNRSDDLEAAAAAIPVSTKGFDYQFSRQGSVVADLRSIVTDWECLDGRRSCAFPLEEIVLATGGFCKENVIAAEDCGVDYFGNLADDSKVIVKIIDSNCSIGDNEFIREAEKIRHITHKNLVNLLGYCSHGIAKKWMFIYRNVDNGNLHQWLHGYPQKVFSPLTWSIRMNIIQGVAKGLAYLHEDVEPQILHGRLRSSCILLDEHWNPKIFGFGLVELFPPAFLQKPWVGETCESVDNGSATPFSEKNDVFSFGILLLEMITGRPPVDFNKSQPYLLEWVKSLIGSEQAVETVDSKLEEKPSSKQFKRMLLIALRCVDPDIQHRPTMRQILLMLHPRDLLLADYQTYDHGIGVNYNPISLASTPPIL